MPSITVVNMEGSSVGTIDLAESVFGIEPNAAVMHLMNFCMEEYIEYLIAHPHIAVYQNGQLKYEIMRIEDYTGGDATVNVSRAANSVIVSVDNMEGQGLGGLIVAMSY